MAQYGPPPKRTAQRRRKNEPDTPVTKAPGADVVEVPAADADWHPVARRWYEALAESGQAAFYEPSDWATAYVIAESMSRDLRPKFVGIDGEGEALIRSMPLNGASLTGYLRAMAVLLVTEGDRRRAGMELHRSRGGSSGGGDGGGHGGGEDATVVDLMKMAGRYA